MEESVYETVDKEDEYEGGEEGSSEDLILVFFFAKDQRGELAGEKK
tara:strand:+ start:1556 stop:1693 length:138 start_codon:yes stop_codon:yes gene_type:complete